jgi:DNA segregation ATPase FtsK/SpoIIIE, S-DNA-T family
LIITKQKKGSLIESVVSSAISLYQDYKIQNPETRKLLEVIQATNLKNDLGEYPTLQSCKDGLYTFRLQPGISFLDFMERKIYFETWTGCQIDIYPTDNPVLLLQVNKTDFPEKIPFTLSTMPTNMLSPVPVGKTPSGETKWVDLADLPHILIGGLPGYGKTSWLIGALLALKTAGVEVCAIDRKRIDFPPLKRWVNVAESEEQACALVKHLLKVNEHRQDILREVGARKIQDYPGIFPPIVLIVDEAAAIESKQTYEGIDSLARLARATGISLLIATQKPSAQLWDKTFSNTRDMCAGRISFYVADYMMSQLILGKGNTNGARLPMVKGRAACVIGDREFTAQTMYLEPVKCEEELNALDCKPYFAEVQPVEIVKPKRGRPKGSKKKEG